LERFFLFKNKGVGFVMKLLFSYNKLINKDDYLFVGNFPKSEDKN
jgi:hypothetical protein